MRGAITGSVAQGLVVAGVAPVPVTSPRAQFLRVPVVAVVLSVPTICSEPTPFLAIEPSNRTLTVAGKEPAHGLTTSCELLSLNTVSAGDAPTRQVTATVCFVVPAGGVMRILVTSTAANAAAADVLPGSGSVIVRLLTGNTVLFVASTLSRTPVPWPSIAVPPGSQPKLASASTQNTFAPVTLRVFGRIVRSPHGICVMFAPLPRSTWAQLRSEVPVMGSSMPTISRVPVLRSAMVPGDPVALANLTVTPVGRSVHPKVDTSTVAGAPARVCVVVAPSQVTLRVVVVVVAGGVTRMRVATTDCRAVIPGAGSVIVMSWIGKPDVLVTLIFITTPPPRPEMICPSGWKFRLLSDWNVFTALPVTVFGDGMSVSHPVEAPSELPGRATTVVAQFSSGLSAWALLLAVPRMSSAPDTEGAMLPLNVTVMALGRPPAHRGPTV